MDLILLSGLIVAACLSMLSVLLAPGITYHYAHRDKAIEQPFDTAQDLTIEL